MAAVGGFVNIVNSSNYGRYVNNVQAPGYSESYEIAIIGTGVTVRHKVQAIGREALARIGRNYEGGHKNEHTKTEQCETDEAAQALFNRLVIDAQASLEVRTHGQAAGYALTVKEEQPANGDALRGERFRSDFLRMLQGDF